MRILFTFAGGSGHLDPLVPVAQAMGAAGHAAAFAARPWMVPKVEALGFAALPAGSDEGLTPVRRPLLPLDSAREERDLRDGFARHIARERAADLRALATDWRPDLIVWEETDFAAPVVAEHLDLPHAAVIVIAAGTFVRTGLITEPLNELRAEYGLGPDPELVMLRRHLVMSPIPPGFRDPAAPLPATAHEFRPFSLEPSTRKGSPPWPEGLPDAPTVYFTLGTVFNMESGDLFSRILSGLRGLPINLVVTVGRDLDPLELGPQPANVHIERFIPQSVVLPHCDLVVSHGGSGSVIGALAHGLPMLLAPMGADQPSNAARCEALGVGRVLDVITATPAEVRAAAALLLADPTYRGAADRIREKFAALPGPESTVPLLERLATDSSLSAM
jgi:UDP:flavonoid glycosyltransferase YjiC (YdhE family)